MKYVSESENLKTLEGSPESYFPAMRFLRAVLERCLFIDRLALTQNTKTPSLCALVQRAGPALE